MTESANYLYVALYDLTSGHKNVLLFKKGDCFIPILSYSKDPNWAVCVDMKGHVGYVPYTYVDKKLVAPKELLLIIDDALEKLHADSPSGISKLIRDAIKDLTLCRSSLLGLTNNIEKCRKEETTEKDINISCISISESTSDIDQAVNNAHLPLNEGDLSVPESPNKLYFKDPENGEATSSQQMADNATQTDKIEAYNVPSWIVPSIVEDIRHKTQISHENSKCAVEIVLGAFLRGIPKLDLLWKQLMETLSESEVLKDQSCIGIPSEDQRKLLDLFKQLWYCKNDEQQRSWPVHEDETYIGGLLTDLNDILMNGNPRITKDIIQMNDYEMVNLLVIYYQMEPRRSLRVKMLHVFLTLCELDSVVLTQLLNSVITMELARDIQDNFEDEEKVQFSSCLLTVIFCTGEHPPNSTYDFFNMKFLLFLFEKLEEVVKDGDEDVGQNLLSIILAFNLHFENVEENIVMSTLKEVKCAQALTEKLIFLLNREDDPCRIINHTTDTQNSISKFMIDLFSFPQLIDLFYLNDIKVLLDIIVRQLTDLLPGEKKRLEYLCLVRNLLKNSNYLEHMHQVDGLQKCFRFILNQEFPDEKEVSIVTDLINTFSDWFGSA